MQVQRDHIFRVPGRFRHLDAIRAVPRGKREAALAAERGEGPGDDGNISLRMSVGSRIGRRKGGPTDGAGPGRLSMGSHGKGLAKALGPTTTPTTNHTHHQSTDLFERSTADLPPPQPPLRPTASPLPQSPQPLVICRLVELAGPVFSTATPREVTGLTSVCLPVRLVGEQCSCRRGQGW